MGKSLTTNLQAANALAVAAHKKALTGIVEIAPTVNQVALDRILQTYRDDVAKAVSDFAIARYNARHNNGGQ